MAWVGAILALVILGAGGVGLMRMREAQAARSVETLCANEHPQNVIAILFDSSDALTELQQVKIQHVLDEIVRGVPKEARVDVYMATAQAGQLALPLFSKCNSFGGEAVGWIDNPQRIQKMHLESFVQPLEKAFVQALRARPRDTSPILETIAAISVQSFGRITKHAKPESGARKLVIISDFLQNSTVLSQYRIYPDIDTFSTEYGYTQTLSSLNGVYVDMVYINRPKVIKLQNQRHRDWWCRYFNTRGAMDCNIEKL